MARDPNAPPYPPSGYNRTYKPRRDSMTAAEVCRRKQGEEAEPVGREDPENLTVEPPAEDPIPA